MGCDIMYYDMAMQYYNEAMAIKARTKMIIDDAHRKYMLMDMYRNMIGIYKSLIARCG
jgi:hypothetical protein